jgi:hypothetical protein
MWSDDITRRLSSSLKGFDMEIGAGEHDIDKLQDYVIGILPHEYVRLLTIANGASGWLRQRYLILYPTEDVIRVNKATEMGTHSKGRLIFASNGGGTSYLLDLGNAEASAVYSCEDVDLGVEQPRRISDSIDEFLQRYGPGVE